MACDPEKHRRKKVNKRKNDAFFGMPVVAFGKGGFSENLVQFWGSLHNTTH